MLRNNCEFVSRHRLSLFLSLFSNVGSQFVLRSAFWGRAEKDMDAQHQLFNLLILLLYEKLNTINVNIYIVCVPIKKIQTIFICRKIVTAILFLLEKFSFQMLLLNKQRFFLMWTPLMRSLFLSI